MTGLLWCGALPQHNGTSCRCKALNCNSTTVSILVVRDGMAGCIGWAMGTEFCSLSQVSCHAQISFIYLPLML
jgi:hypothetical protein